MRKIFSDLLKGDKGLWSVFLFLCAISMVEVFSASSSLTYHTSDQFVPIGKHIMSLGGGFLLAFFFHKIIRIKYLTDYVIYAYWGVCVFLLLIVSLSSVGGTINGAARWIRIGGFTVQPSEWTKLAIVMVTAMILAKNQLENNADGKKVFKNIWLAVVPILLIFKENASTGLILSAVVFFMLCVGRVKWAFLFKFILVCVAMLSAFLFTPKSLWHAVGVTRIETFHSRLWSWADEIGQDEVPPEEYDLKKNIQRAHADMAVSSAGIIGCLPGNSVQRDHLPQAYSDFIFAIIIEELGLVGAAGVMFLYFVLFIRAGQMACRCRDNPFKAYLIMGLALVIVFQALVNMAVAVHIMPVTGQPLPLISRGINSVLVTSVMFGLMLSASWEEKKEEKVRREAEEAEKIEEARMLARAMKQLEVEEAAALENEDITE